MKKFNIRALKIGPKKENNKLYQYGKIVIDDFSERFLMPLDYWSVNQYENQWKDGIERLKVHDYSCLVAKITREDNEFFVAAWIVYKVENMIYLQYHFLLDEEQAKKISTFDLETCYEFIRPRSEFTPDGNRYEEWSISVDDFFASIGENEKAC